MYIARNISSHASNKLSNPLLLLQSYMEDHLKNKDRMMKEWEVRLTRLLFIKKYILHFIYCKYRVWFDYTNLFMSLFVMAIHNNFVHECCNYTNF